MCIHWYVTLIQCSGVSEICGQLGGTSAMGICAFFYMWHWTVQMWNLPLHLPIWGLTGEMWNCHSWPLYVTLIWCCGIPQIYGWLDGGTSAMGICVFCYMWHWFSVVVFQRCMVNWGGGRSASRSATSSANMSSNSRNVKSPFLTTRCQYWGRSASRSANMSSNSSNVKLPFLTTRCQYGG